MNAQWALLLVAVFAIGVVGAACWHRHSLKLLRARLEENEDSRLMLEEQVHELRQRVEVSDVSPDDAGERRRVLKQTLTAAAAGESHWPETQPASMLPHPDTAYAPTQPAELAPEPAR